MFRAPVGSDPPARIPWRRVLYERQPYRDNHYDPDKFFDQLSILVHDQLPKYSFSDAIQYASLLAQQFSAVTFFLTIYQFILSGQVSLEALCLLDLVALVAGSSVYFILLPTPSLRLQQGLEFARVSVLFFICLRLASPVVRTLTSSVSEDSIYAASIVLCLVHLVSHDYRRNQSVPAASSGTLGSSKSDSPLSDSVPAGILPLDAARVAQSGEQQRPESSRVVRQRSRAAMLSLSTAMFTAMMLASRLQSASMVVAFVIFAVITFTLFPMVCRILRDRLRIFQFVLALTQWTITSRLVWILETSVFDVAGTTLGETMPAMTSSTGASVVGGQHTLFVIYQTIVVLLWLVGPSVFLILRRKKQILRGPWDIPRID